PDVAVADKVGAAATPTSATTAPATPNRSANPPCAVLASTDAAPATAATTGAAGTTDNGQSAAIDEAGAVGTADADTPAASSPTVASPATPTETVSDPGTDAPTALGGVLSGLLGSDENADADVPDAADTPVPAPGTSARLNDPQCVTHEGGGRKLTVGVTNTTDETATTTEEPSVAVDAEVLDAVSLEVQLDHGVTTLDLHLPPECEVDEHDRSIVNCLVGNLLPGASISSTLDLGLDGDGGGATVTVKSGDTTLDVQALDLLPALPALPDLTKGLLPGG
ncbi:MAG TPA: hypothetical protein VGO78_11490, partial [Acidimicrobiales bacterium]|nr:hypothetical protein [Acidimicrobiales bacterium]